MENKIHNFIGNLGETKKKRHFFNCMCHILHTIYAHSKNSPLTSISNIIYLPPQINEPFEKKKIIKNINLINHQQIKTFMELKWC